MYDHPYSTADWPESSLFIGHVIHLSFRSGLFSIEGTILRDLLLFHDNFEMNKIGKVTVAAADLKLTAVSYTYIFHAIGIDEQTLLVRQKM